MKRAALHIISLLIAVAFTLKAHAKTPVGKVPAHLEKYIVGVYMDIDFTGNNKLDYDVFKKGLIGYINLKRSGKVAKGNHIFTICDFSMPSTDERMWIIDLKQRKVLLNTHVAHGQGSGDNYANEFSNIHESHQSSIGFFVTGSTYIGKHGNSLRLIGMDKGYNCAAMDRAIVVHGADYVSYDFIKSHQRLGRSWGCPAVSAKVSDAVINYIKEGSVFFIYYPSERYLTDSYWLNKALDIHFLRDDGAEDPEKPSVKEPHIVEKVIKYQSNL